MYVLTGYSTTLYSLDGREIFVLPPSCSPGKRWMRGSVRGAGTALRDEACSEIVWASYSCRLQFLTIIAEWES